MKDVRLILLVLIINLLISSNLYAQKISSATKKRISKLELQLKSTNGAEKAKVYNTLAEIYLDIDTKKSVSYCEEALKISKKNNLSPLIKADIYNTLGAAYFYQKNYKKSAGYYEDELQIIEKQADKTKIAEATYNIATLYKKEAKDKKAVEYYGKSLAIAKALKNETLQILNYKALYEIYNSDKKYKEALDNFQLYVSLKDSRLMKQSKSDITVLRRKYTEEKQLREAAEEVIVEKDSVLTEIDSSLKVVTVEKTKLVEDTMVKSHQIKMLTIEKEYQKQMLAWRQAELTLTTQLVKKQEKIIWLALGIGIIILVSGIWLFMLYRKIKDKNKQLADSKEEIEVQRDLIEKKNSLITDSIIYASRIQNSILIPEKEIQKHLPEMFIYFQPKDIVSGDFYWFAKVDNKYIIAAIDCTGHGVPGAFLSMIGNTLLQEIVNKNGITQPALILSHLHTGVLNALHQNDAESEAEDGMDMSLCTIDVHKKRFQFAGAKNHLYVIQKNQLKVLKANLFSIGGKPLRTDTIVEFTSYDFMYDDNTSIYMFSDGYLDQFGGVDNTKFNSAQFKEMLLSSQSLPMLQQKEVISDTMSKWRNSRPQIDDMLVVGINLGCLN